MALLDHFRRRAIRDQATAGAFIDEQSFRLAESCVRDYSRLRAGDGADALLADAAFAAALDKACWEAYPRALTMVGHGRGGERCVPMPASNAHAVLFGLIAMILEQFDRRPVPRAIGDVGMARGACRPRALAQRSRAGAAEDRRGAGARPFELLSRDHAAASEARRRRLCGAAQPAQARRCCTSRRRSRSARTCWRWPASWPAACPRLKTQRSAVRAAGCVKRAHRLNRPPAYAACVGCHLTHRDARGIDRPTMPSPSTQCRPAAGRNPADRRGGRHHLREARDSGRPRVRLGAGGGDRRAGRPADAGAERRSARLLRAGRHPARRDRHARDAQGHGDLAAQHRDAGGRDHRHDRRHHVLSALRPRLGLGLGLPGRVAGRDGAGRRALGRVQGRSARRRDRAGDAGAADHDRAAGQPGAVRARRRRGDRRAGARGRLVAGRARGPGRRVDRAGAAAALDEISRRAAVRRDGGLRHPARHRLGACGPAVVAWRRRGDRDRRGRGLALLQHQLAHGGRLSRRGDRIVRGRGRGRRPASPCW